MKAEIYLQLFKLHYTLINYIKYPLHILNITYITYLHLC